MKDRDYTGGIVIFMLFLLFAFCTAACIVWAVKDGNTVSAKTAVMESGVSVSGTATQIKKLGRNNVELAYEGNGSSCTAKVTVSGKIFKQYDGKGADRDGTAEVTVYFDSAEPSNATFQGEIDTAKSLKIQYIVGACFMGLVVVGILLLAVILLLPDRKGASSKREPDYSINGKGVYDLRTDTEKKAEANASSSLPEPLEGYAKEIVRLFERYPEMYEREPKLREIGKKINNNEKQLLVAHRSKYLAEQAGLGNAFSTRYLEYAWDGIGGWMS